MLDLSKIFGRKKSSKDLAKDRLKLVLVHDRANVSPDFLESIKDEIKGYIVMNGWRMGDVARKISKPNSKSPLQNLSNKLNNETIRYTEVKEIADALGYEIKWEKK